MTATKAIRALRERARQLKAKWPGYGAVLDFYVKVREAQASAKASSRVDPATFRKDEGCPLLAKEDFPVDIAASTGLFHSLCRIGKKANPHLAEQIGKMTGIVAHEESVLEKLLARAGDEQAIERFAAERGLDKQVLSFLVGSSTRPSIEAGSKQLRAGLELETWRQGQCPVCGSLPALSLLKREGGSRYALCSYCACEWRIERLFCAVCGNKEQESLQYFVSEGEEVYRIDLCDQCHHYIKTIDYRSLEESDPCLEDLATLHLDVVAADKGYARVVPNPWTTREATQRLM